MTYDVKVKPNMSLCYSAMQMFYHDICALQPMAQTQRLRVHSLAANAVAVFLMKIMRDDGYF